LNPKGSTVCLKCGTVFEKTISGEPLQATEQSAQVETKPTRRIVRRPAEKKAIPKKPEGGVPPEGQVFEPGPEDQPKP
jgi:hypothetical protein